MTSNNQIMKRLTDLETNIARLTELSQSALSRLQPPKTIGPEPASETRVAALLEELDKRGSMTMKDIADFQGVSIQTAWVTANEASKERARCVLVTEPHGRNKRLRIVSARLMPEFISHIARLGAN